MKVPPTAIPEVLITEPKVFGDARGFFYESFNQQAFNEATSTNYNFVQDNHSRSVKGALRGLHYQIQQPQGKLVRVVRGAMFDVAVDIRKGSPTFGQWVGIELTEDNHKQLWMLPGFVHGFWSLVNLQIFCTRPPAITCSEHERCIAWDDSTIGIQWPLTTNPSLLAKDQQGFAFRDAETF